MANGPDGDDGLDEIETGVATRTRPKTKKPSNYKVLMLNDDYTPMEFVVLVLQRFFSMGIEDATRVMLQVHQQGIAVCGVFTYEVAETKVSQVIDFARENQHPLQCTLEKARPSRLLASPLIGVKARRWTACEGFLTSRRPARADAIVASRTDEDIAPSARGNRRP